LKSINTFRQYLNERMSDVVYHYTTSKAALSILKYNKMYGTIANNDFAQQVTIGPSDDYFISFTRTKYANVGYSKMVSRNDHGLGWVRFEIDGRGITNHGKVAPFDFGYGDEMEDRLWMSKPFIPYIRKYIKSIHVYGRNDNSDTMGYNKLIDKLAKKHNIPTFFYYGDRKAFDIMDVSKADMDYWDQGKADVEDSILIDTTDAKNAAMILAAVSYNDPTGEKMVTNFINSIDWPLPSHRYIDDWPSYIDKYIDRYKSLFAKPEKASWIYYHDRLIRDYRKAFRTITYKALSIALAYNKKRGHADIEDMFIAKNIVSETR